MRLRVLRHGYALRQAQLRRLARYARRWRRRFAGALCDICGRCTPTRERLNSLVMVAARDRRRGAELF